MKNHDATLEAVRALPPVGVGALSVAGLPLNEWVLILTIIYTLFLIIDKLPVVWQRIKQFGAYLKGLRNDSTSKR